MLLVISQPPQIYHVTLWDHATSRLEATDLEDITYLKKNVIDAISPAGRKVPVRKCHLCHILGFFSLSV